MEHNFTLTHLHILPTSRTIKLHLIGGINRHEMHAATAFVPIAVKLHSLPTQEIIKQNVSTKLFCSEILVMKRISSIYIRTI